MKARIIRLMNRISDEWTASLFWTLIAGIAFAVITLTPLRTLPSDIIGQTLVASTAANSHPHLISVWLKSFTETILPYLLGYLGIAFMVTMIVVAGNRWNKPMLDTTSPTIGDEQ